MTTVPQPCARCGELIPAERLDAMPGTMVCVACSNEIGSEHSTTYTAGRTNKPGSIRVGHGSDYEKQQTRKSIRPKDEE